MFIYEWERLDFISTIIRFIREQELETRS